MESAPGYFRAAINACCVKQSNTTRLRPTLGIHALLSLSPPLLLFSRPPVTIASHLQARPCKLCDIALGMWLFLIDLKILNLTN